MPRKLEKREELCPAAVSQKQTKCGVELGDVPAASRTEEMCLAAVRQNGRALESVPEALRTLEMCFAAVRQCGHALKDVPEFMRSAKLCHLAVRGSEVLHLVPTEFRSEKLCRAALRRGIWALDDVPDELLSTELCLAAFSDRHEYDVTLGLCYVPEALLRAEGGDKICLAAIEWDGEELQYVPLVVRTKKLCMAAVRHSGLALEFVPSALHSEKLCAIAVEQDGLALEHVPESMRSTELCTLAVQEDGTAIRFVPPRVMDLNAERLCRIAIFGAPPRAVDLRPEASPGSGACQTSLLLKHVPVAERTVPVCLAAVQKNAAALKHVPEAVCTIGNMSRRAEAKLLVPVLRARQAAHGRAVLGHGV